MAKRLSIGAHAAAAKYKSWTSSDIDNLMVFRDLEKMEWIDIADELGRSVESCVARYRIMGGKVDFQGRPDHESTRGIHEKVFAERDVRLAAMQKRNEQLSLHGDLSFLIGDMPPPGRSALDQKRRVRA